MDMVIPSRGPVCPVRTAFPRLAIPVVILLVSLAETSGDGAAWAGEPDVSEAGPEASGEKTGYLSPPELMKLIETSKVTYKIGAIGADLKDVKVEEIAPATWPKVGGELQQPWVSVSEDGSRILEAYELEEGCLELLKRGEELFSRNDYRGAAFFYKKTVKKYPKCYVAHANLGDCHYFQGDAARALPLYDRTIELNPWDFIGHFFRANALVRLGRMDEARRSYVQALVLRPHRESVVKAARANAAKLGIRVNDDPFQPRALARHEGEQVAIYADLDLPYWIAYGICKGVWLGEPAHRLERLGTEEHNFTVTEERQCLMSLLDSYYALREDGMVKEDPAMERLLAAAEKRLLDGFLMYEIAYRLGSDVLLLFPEEMRGELVAYVDAFVLAREAEPAP